MFRTGLVAAGICAALAASPAASYETELRFVRDGVEVARLSLTRLTTACGVERVEVGADPYYATSKSFWAVSLRCVVELGFAAPITEHAGANFFLRALDGYTQPASAQKLAEAGGYLAFSDAERGNRDNPAWEPIDRRQVDPGPFYLIWVEPGQNDLHRYPWPYQLATLEIAPFESEYPHTVPTGAAAGSPALRGFAIFRSECIACHAVNGEGGKIGPDLNVPQSIVEYRPARQIKDFVRDPQSFRYTSMPSHLHLSEADLDALVAYFTAMKDRKNDPGGARH